MNMDIESQLHELLRELLIKRYMKKGLTHKQAEEKFELRIKGSKGSMEIE